MPTLLAVLSQAILYSLACKYIIHESCVPLPCLEKEKAAVQNLNTICLNRKYTDLDSDVLSADDQSHSNIQWKNVCWLLKMLHRAGNIFRTEFGINLQLQGHPVPNLSTEKCVHIAVIWALLSSNMFYFVLHHLEWMKVGMGFCWGVGGWLCSALKLFDHILAMIWEYLYWNVTLEVVVLWSWHLNKEQNR